MKSCTECSADVGELWSGLTISAIQSAVCTPPSGVNPERKSHAFRATRTSGLSAGGLNPGYSKCTGSLGPPHIPPIYAMYSVRPQAPLQSSYLMHSSFHVHIDPISIQVMVIFV